MTLICNALGGGILKDCDNNWGGIKSLYITELGNISSVTHDSPSRRITAINMLNGAKFYKFEFNKNTSTYTQSTASNQENGSEVCLQTVTLAIRRMEQAKRDIIMKLGKFKDLAVIVEDSNDLHWLLGETEGLITTQKDSGPGTTKQDPNGWVITMTGEEQEEACNVADDALTSIIYVD
jgi:hypothetical protein